MEAIETNSFAGDLLGENCGRQNLDTRSNEVLGGLIVTEANDEPLDVVRSVAKEDNSIDLLKKLFNTICFSQSCCGKN